MTYIIKTPRLGLRTWKEQDLLPFAQLTSNKEVMQYYPNLLTLEQTKGFITRIQQQYEDFGFSVYAVDKLDTGQFIGYIGFMRPSFESDFTPCVEIGWRLDNAFWNQGLATEGALACLDYGFNNLGFDEIFSFTSVLNNPSERVMQKIGLKKIGEFEHPMLAEGHKLRRHVLYKTIKSLIEPNSK